MQNVNWGLGQMSDEFVFFKQTRRDFSNCYAYNILSLELTYNIPHRPVHDRNVELPAPGHSDQPKKK